LGFPLRTTLSRFLLDGSSFGDMIVGRLPERLMKKPDRLGERALITGESLRAALGESLATHALNRLDSGDRVYDEPLVGIASANDPYFLEFTRPEVIGNVFRVPGYWLDGASSVVSFFLPFSEIVRKSNRLPGPPSPEWLHARFRGEDVNNEAKRFVVSLIQAEGYRAVAPTLDSRFVRTEDLRCSWSERHVAFVAGLGTFGLSRGLITSKGMAGRFGSVVTDLKIAPTPRPYSNPFEYCLFLSGKAPCKACIERCPVQAITDKGKDHPPCSDYLRREDLVQDVKRRFGYGYMACGKCQTGVPCESGIPL
jgi:epoxyqueuosine reductase